MRGAWPLPDWHIEVTVNILLLTSEFAPVRLRGRNLRPIAIPKTNR